ncbi:MAG: c-type cytochrome [Bdellovibrionaceae bacterium]|jgi:thiosulfate dehydrogenase|nr:c-type cytochrome [Pseudobdellovibrionaceae bacterium]
MEKTHSSSSKWAIGIFSVLLLASLVWTYWGLKEGHEYHEASRVWGLQVPDFALVDLEPNAQEIKEGKDILENTPARLPEFVGAKINCTNCHLNSGTKPNAGHYVGIIHRFPQYRDRSGKEDTLEDRINDCFERSLNGKRLPNEHPGMRAIVAYMTWLSKPYPPTAKKIEGMGMPKLVVNRQPDLEKGKAVYEQKCQMCHQPGGQGIILEEGKISFPPLWGDYSFNVGAGMARLHTAAGFVKKNMPLGQDNSLSDEEAWDVAYYFSQQPRPDFARKHLDWPKGNKPKDARY